MANFYDLSQPPMTGQSGPLIYDNHPRRCGSSPCPRTSSPPTSILQTYQGKPALSWWQGDLTNAGETITGEDVIVNQHYQQVATLKGVDGWMPTLHELVVDGDHAWVTANKNIPMDLSKYGGAYNGALIDSAVQEYDIKTGKLLYSWDALEHIPLDDSYASLPTNGFPWDAYHVNAIQLHRDGTFVVSMRNTWAAYLVDTGHGKIQWTLGGKHSSFKLGPRADFAVAARRRAAPGLDGHDVRRPLLPDHRRRHVRDPDGAIARAGAEARPAGPHGDLVSEYAHGDSFDADYMGSTQPLRNGDSVRRLGIAAVLLRIRRHRAS